MENRIKKLPVWAQNYIKKLKTDVQDLEDLKTLHGLLSDADRDWHTIRPNKIKSENEKRNGFQLFSLHEGMAVHQVSLYDDDVLFVGRSNRGGDGKV